MSLYIAIAPDDLQRLTALVRLLIELFLSSNTKAGETPADDRGLRVPVLMLLDEFLSLGRVDKLVHALAYVRGWGIRIATVIQSEAQLQAVYGRELAEAFIDNHRARVYYRPPVHRRDLAEQISKIVGQRTVNQTSYSYADGRRSRQVSKTGQSILDTDEIAHLREDETSVFSSNVPPSCRSARPLWMRKCASWSMACGRWWGRSSATTGTGPSSSADWRPCPSRHRSWRPCRRPPGSR